ncbi:MAG: phosphonoacetaldehyde reductase, partial [Acidimicrobiia bacterium]|nr:phosphonoacetaldehyde reductase [Acidimicrobiia bacterium]
MPHRAIAYGDGALRALPGRIGDDRRVLLVTGRDSFDSSGASDVVEPLRRIAVVRRWCDFAPNTDAGDLWNGLQVVAEFEAEVIVGIGGGSVMDMAKLLCAFRGVESEEQLHAAIRAGRSIDVRGVGLILAPTTSGSGSEATHFAVVYIGDEKFSVAGPALRPDFTALDPNLAMTGSAHQRATSGIDAVCQAIESRWASGATRRSQRYAEFALPVLLANLEPFVVEPDARTARAMQFGSHLSGRAIDISKTTAAHALAYGISKRYGVDHGNAVALTLPHFIEVHDDVAPERLNPSVDPAAHRCAMEFVRASLDASDGERARDAFIALLDRIGLPSTMSGVGYQPSDGFEALVGSVNVQRLG